MSNPDKKSVESAKNKPNNQQKSDGRQNDALTEKSEASTDTQSEFSRTEALREKQ